jgi:hypothetical protein
VAFAENGGSDVSGAGQSPVPGFSVVESGLPVEKLAPGVITACSDGATLAELERQFATVDPMLVRSVVFRLVLRGDVRCPALPFEPLGPNTYLELV